MREFFWGAGTIAAGILVAAVVLIGAWHVMQPPASVSIDMSKYDCGTDGRKIQCNRV